ncbi:MAG TPA: PEGA domain-containing protein [Pseudomonadales bacterium]|nr:PEGA domain-containing protein [Pseudomonadales bacterium]
MNDRRDDADLIEPAEFRRADPHAQRTRARLPVRTLLVSAALLVLAAVALFMFVGRPVQILVTPEPDALSVDGGPSFVLGDRYLLLPGTYHVRAELAGHHPLDEAIVVGRKDNGPFEFTMRRLPGRLTVTTLPVDGAEVRVDGEPLGTTPLADVPIEPGTRQLSITAARYLPAERTLEVEGMARPVAVRVELEPAWADVTVATTPPGASLRVDGEAIEGTTPTTAEIIAGDRELTLHLEGYKTLRRRLQLTPSQAVDLGTLALERIDGLLVVETRPAGATVTVNDVYRGRTPAEIDLRPGATYRVDLFKAGHEPVRRSVRIESGTASRLQVDLAEILGELRVAVQPADARLIVDGSDRGVADQTLSLSSVSHEVEVRKEGYVPYRTSVTPRPGFPQEITLTLKTIEQARLDAIKPEIVAASGQKLLLLRPGSFTMGASRRQPGRRANEVLREVTLTRPFYLATTEVTNAQFRAFAPGHDSGSFEQFDLDADDHPAVNLAWRDAVAYCNWLSRRDGLREVYRIEGGSVVGFDPDATGYRLPTEAEWAWAARIAPDGSTAQFPWGDSRLPPADRLGNFADRAVAHLLARSIPDYTDGQVVTGPVANYAPNARGLYDLGGNAAEWINDFYGATEEELPAEATDPLGPPRGEYHVIRGSSWMHGQLVDLRWTFRDYGTDGRPDVGFRIARWLE